MDPSGTHGMGCEEANGMHHINAGEFCNKKIAGGAHGMGREGIVGLHHSNIGEFGNRTTSGGTQ